VRRPPPISFCMTLAAIEQRAPREGAPTSSVDFVGHRPTNSTIGGNRGRTDAFFAHTAKKASNAGAFPLDALFFQPAGAVR
jgi:hypothetical protein